MRLIVAVLFITAVALPTSASAEVKRVTYNEAYRAATAYAEDLVPGSYSIIYPTGYSLSPCERVSRIKFHCRDVLFYEDDGPDTHLIISVQRVKSGRLKVFTSFPPVRRLTYSEAYQTAAAYAEDLVPGPSSNYPPHSVTGSSVSSCKRLSRIKFHCRGALSYQDAPDCDFLISVQRVWSGRLNVVFGSLASCPRVG